MPHQRPIPLVGPLCVPAGAPAEPPLLTAPLPPDTGYADELVAGEVPLVPELPSERDGLPEPLAAQSVFPVGATGPERLPPPVVPELPVAGVLLRITAGGQSTVAPGAEVAGVPELPLLSGAGDGVATVPGLPLVEPGGISGMAGLPLPKLRAPPSLASGDGACAQASPAAAASAAPRIVDDSAFILFSPRINNTVP